LNSILQTRDSARGLIISMSDVLFGTGQYSLMPGTREKLAKVAGILAAYPSLNIEVGGYTDNVGADSMNQRLSENRANSVRTYLVREGVAASSVMAKGFGNSPDNIERQLFWPATESESRAAPIRRGHR
jgi:outer membrane protein OmpA-like peptidoglycan-associated protein